MQPARSDSIPGIPNASLRPAAPDGGDGGGRKEFRPSRGQGLALICQGSPHLRDLARHRAQTVGVATGGFARESMGKKRARSAPRKVSCARNSENLAKPCLSEPCQPIWVAQYLTYVAILGSADGELSPPARLAVVAALSHPFSTASCAAGAADAGRRRREEGQDVFASDPAAVGSCHSCYLDHHGQAWRVPAPG
eukprot:COSAG02_NODE_8145_length_2691_cov_99.361111_2_plen_195_part_00